MANIVKRPDGRWRARYRDRTGKELAAFRAQGSTPSAGSMR